MPKKVAVGNLYEIRIHLMYFEPAIWRRVVVVPHDITLAKLHTVIQVAMGWEDSHLHEFQIGKERYGPVMPDPFGFDEPPVDERIVQLYGVAKPKAKFIYQYDFGDDWLHELHIEREMEPQSARRHAGCIAGENAGPPEDCGGPPGYANLLEILSNPAHEEYGPMREWVGDDFDPRHFDLVATDRRISRLKV